jgi:glycosyltransferase involved in cell wall biosynthesis
MRICIDARSLRPTPTGLGRYAANLTGHLARIDKDNEYIIIRRPSSLGPIVEQPNFREIFLPYDISSVKNILFGAATINALEADIYHALFHFLPLGVRARQRLITLHDLIWVDHAKLSDGRNWRRWIKATLGGSGVRRAMETADHIITVSDSTRLTAVEGHGMAASKFTVIYHGVEADFFKPSTADPPKACKGRRYIFALGNSLPYKNIPRLVLAFAKIAAEEKDLMLVLGGRGEGYRELARLLARLNLTERVHFSEQMTEEQLRACYSHALFFAFPSLMEGFGLPIIEAMACGCPVLTSNCSAPAEIVADTALQIDPYDTEAIAQGMRHMLGDASYRQRLAEAGRRRATLFNWDQSARQTLDTYQRLLSATYL